MLKIDRKIVLASASPRRIELLKAIGLKFTVHASHFKELDTHALPVRVALHNACGKAMAVAPYHKNAFVIGVDTIGALDGKIFGKPKDNQDAKRILRTLSGRTHDVISGICIIDTKIGKKYTTYEKTKVTFAPMTSIEINAYVASGEQRDKAAAFAIQGLGSLFIKKINGDYFNVVGLPVFKFGRLLRRIQKNL